MKITFACLFAIAFAAPALPQCKGLECCGLPGFENHPKC
jgi:hypothetical protein